MRTSCDGLCQDYLSHSEEEEEEEEEEEQPILFLSDTAVMTSVR